MIFRHFVESAKMFQKFSWNSNKYCISSFVHIVLKELQYFKRYNFQNIVKFGKIGKFIIDLWKIGKCKNIENLIFVFWRKTWSLK